MISNIVGGTVIAWNGDTHYVLEDGVVVFSGNEIIYVGSDYSEPVDRTIDATGQLVIPGFVNIHLHLCDTNFTKGLLEDGDNVSSEAKSQNFKSLYNIFPSLRGATDPDAQLAGATCALAQLARTGSTTIVEMGFDFEIGGDGDISITENVAKLAGESGLRCYTGPRYRTRFYGLTESSSVFYENYPDNARKRTEDCVTFCQDWNGRFDDRLRTMLAPGQVDTCDPDLLRDTRRYANELKIPIQLHAGQSPNEFEWVRQTYGKTTIEFLEDVGLLGPDLIIGHGQILSADGDADSMAPHEVALLRDSKTTLCHIPWIKARRGSVINSIQKYRDKGFRQGIGTDSYPFDMFNEMRMASVVCKIVESSSAAACSPDIFHMATVGGADALGRGDLGRLAPGCKADIVMVRRDTLRAAPLYDPFKFLVMGAAGDDVDTVIVDGKTIVDGGKVQTIDVPDAIEKLNKASQRVWDNLELG